MKRYLGALGLTVLRAVSLAASIRCTHKEIRICSGILRRSCADDFFSICRNALDVFEQYDGRRFSLFQRHVKRIVGSEFHTQLALVPRIMELNYDVASRSDAVDIASLMVHELTHARLAWRVKHDDMERIERLCLIEQERFLKKAGRNPRKTPSQLLRTKWWSNEAKQNRLDKVRRRRL